MELSNLELDKLSDKEILILIYKKVDHLERRIDEIDEIIHGNTNTGLRGLKTLLQDHDKTISVWKKYQFAAGVFMGAGGFLYTIYKIFSDIGQHITIK